MKNENRIVLVSIDTAKHTCCVHYETGVTRTYHRIPFSIAGILPAMYPYRYASNTGSDLIIVFRVAPIGSPADNEPF